MVMLVNKLYIRNNFLKKIYFNAARSLMDNCFNYMKQYIDHQSIGKLCFYIKQSPSPVTVQLQDCYGAFVTALCTRLCNELYDNHYSITVLDPHYTEKVIYQLYIPDKNISVINNTYSKRTCKANDLYSVKEFKNTINNRFIANDFFKNVYK